MVDSRRDSEEGSLMAEAVDWAGGRAPLVAYLVLSVVAMFGTGLLLAYAVEYAVGHRLVPPNDLGPAAVLVFVFGFLSWVAAFALVRVVVRLAFR